MSYANAATTTDIYSYPIDSNRLSSISSSTGSTRTLTYDDAGNVTYDNRSGPGYGYNYDAAGRMSAFAINGVVQAEYEYNFLGQQIIRRLTQTGETIHALHDAAGNRIAEYDYDESLGTSTLLREYIWADGMVVAVVEAGQMYFVRTDHIGRPVFATDDAGAKVWEASYRPFGGVQTSTGANAELRFPGQWFQSETALHQNWMRDYDPTTGRYIQADPLGLVDGASVYGYVTQNPGRYVDPRGEQRISVGPRPPLPLPGTPEGTAAGQTILDLSEKYNPFYLLFKEIMEICTSERPMCSLYNESPIPGTNLNACYYQCPNGDSFVIEVPALIPTVVGSCPAALPQR